jgi:fumarylacetoacetate (FAA) hydrolase family protein
MSEGDRDPFDDIFAPELNPVAQTPEPPPVAVQLVGGDAAAKLGRNLGLALERQSEILAKPITDETDAREKRLQADVAHQVVKTAVGVDANSLKERENDNTLARIFQRIAEARERLGERLAPEEILRLDAGPSSEPAEPHKRT